MRHSLTATTDLFVPSILFSISAPPFKIPFYYTQIPLGDLGAMHISQRIRESPAAERFLVYFQCFTGNEHHWWSM